MRGHIIFTHPHVRLVDDEHKCDFVKQIISQVEENGNQAFSDKSWLTVPWTFPHEIIHMRHVYEQSLDNSSSPQPHFQYTKISDHFYSLKTESSICHHYFSSPLVPLSYNPTHPIPIPLPPPLSQILQVLNSHSHPFPIAHGRHSQVFSKFLPAQIHQDLSVHVMLQKRRPVTGQPLSLKPFHDVAGGPIPGWLCSTKHLFVRQFALFLPLFQNLRFQFELHFFIQRHTVGSACIPAPSSLLPLPSFLLTLRPEIHSISVNHWYSENQATGSHHPCP